MRRPLADRFPRLVARIVALRAEGLNQCTIADRCCVSQTTVSRALRESQERAG